MVISGRSFINLDVDPLGLLDKEFLIPCSRKVGRVQGPWDFHQEERGECNGPGFQAAVKGSSSCNCKVSRMISRRFGVVDLLPSL